MHVIARPLKRYPWYLRPFFWNQHRKYGQVLMPGLLWARVPRLFVAVAWLYGMLDLKRSRVSPLLRSLVTVRVSQINHCRFCVDLNAATLARRAGTMDKVVALADWPDSPLFDDRERTVLEFAEAVTLPERRVDAAMIARLRRYFDDEGLIELTALIAFQNLSSKFNRALDVPAQGFCTLPSTSAPDRSNAP